MFYGNYRNLIEEDGVEVVFTPATSSGRQGEEIVIDVDSASPVLSADGRWGAALAQPGFEDRETSDEPDTLLSFAVLLDLESGEETRFENPEEFADASAARFHGEAAFYEGIEQAFFDEMGTGLSHRVELPPLEDEAIARLIACRIHQVA